MALFVLALYFWAFFSVDLRSSIGDSLLVSTHVAIVAGITVLAGGILWLWAPRKPRPYITFTIYALLALMTMLLIADTGGVSSPFIALWMGVAVFSGVFGAVGLVPVFLAVNTYLIALFFSGQLRQGDLIIAVLAGELPVIASLLLWNRADSPEASDDQPKRDPRMYRQLSTELSELADQSEVVINAIGDGVLAVDTQGVVQLINPAAQQLLGWSRQDALTLNYKSVLNLTDDTGKPIPESSDPILQVLNTNQEVRSKDLSITTKSGKKILIAVVVSPVGQAGSGAIVVFRDITKEKAEEREQAEFISTASHEMRTPVASIEGYLGLALNPNTAQIDDKARDFITKAHESAQHLGRLFQDLLDVSKAEDGRLSNNPQVLDIVSFVGDVVEGLRPKATDKGLQLTYKPAPNDDAGERRLSPVYYVNLDKDHIREIVNNLTENAIKYTLQGEVTVDVTGDDETVTVAIKDSGIGIPAEDLPHLFQKFYRVDNSDTREIGGTGLGLYLCRRLAEAMGGRVWAESEYQRGSTFYLQLPRVSNQEARSLQQEQANMQATPDPATNVFVPEQTPPAPTQAPAPVAQAPAPVSAAPPVAPPQVPLTPPVQPQAPIPTPQAAPQAPVAQPQTAQAYAAYPQAPASAAQAPNTPLTSIEQNPAAYTQQRPGSVAVPDRNPPTQ